MRRFSGDPPSAEFSHRTGNAISNDARHKLLGPIALPDSSPFRGVPLLIGKVVSNCRTGDVS
jgi:hypothetical protein